MNVRLAALSITLVASASTSLNPALAREAKGARFDFAPNIYKLEDARVPQESYSATSKPVHPAMEGKVPHGPSFLGVDPQFLTKPVISPAPVTRTQVAMRPSTAPTSLTSPFKPGFGAPSAPPPQSPQSAQPKMLPSFGSPSTLPHTSANQSVAGKLVPHKSSPVLASRSLNGKLLNRKHASGQSANPALALKPIESYGKGVGYVPGAYLPVNSGSRVVANSSLYGRILTKH
jgi:hypothetical protein